MEGGLAPLPSPKVPSEASSYVKKEMMKVDINAVIVYGSEHHLCVVFKKSWMVKLQKFRTFLAPCQVAHVITTQKNVRIK